MAENTKIGPLRQPQGAFALADVFVWGVWLAMSGYLLSFVYTTGATLPYWDEWELIPYLCGQKAVTLEWLWSQHNEHRILVPKLAYLFLMRHASGDERTCMYFSALLLSAIALAMIVLARRLRGRVHFTDAFFPMIFLHFGHYENVLFPFQIAFTIPAFLICMAVCTLASESGLPHLRSIFIVGICSMLLPVCVGSGLLVAPFLVLSLLWIAYQHWQSLLPNSRQNAAISALFAIATCVIVALYALTYVPPPNHPAYAGRRAVLVTAGYFLANSLGAVGIEWWPFSVLLVLAVIAATILLLLKTVRAQNWTSESSIRPLSLLLLVAGILTLALAVGRGRAGMGVLQGACPRHSIFAVIALCIAYLSFNIYARPWTARCLHIVLFAAICAALPSNRSAGITTGESHLAASESFLAELRRGVPLDTAVQAHYQEIYPDPNELRSRILMLSEKRYGAFSNLDIRTK